MCKTRFEIVGLNVPGCRLLSAVDGKNFAHKLVEYGHQVREGILGGSWKCLGMSQSILRWDAWKSLGMLGSVLGGFGPIFFEK